MIRAAFAALALVGAVQLSAGAIVPVKALVAQHLLARAFDRSVAARHAEPPWPWADMTPRARLTVPRLGIDRIVLDSGSGQAMAFAPTLLPGGAPLGRGGTSVIAAHRDTHFAFLRVLRRGDLLTIATLNGAGRTYSVRGAAIVRWDRFAVTRSGPDRLALVTCYPFNATERGPLRYVVYADAT